jgi:DNA-binding transcriptional LysR family regulator
MRSAGWSRCWKTGWASLFRRKSRGVVLTEAGRGYLARVEALLDQLADATADLQRDESASKRPAL